MELNFVHKKRWFVYCAALSLGMFVTSPSGFAGDAKGPVVVIANKDYPSADISMNDLKACFKLEKKLVGNAETIIFLRPSGSPEGEVAMKKIYEMGADQLETYWTARIFQGHLTSQPSTKRTASLAIAAVSREKGALSLVSLKEANEQVKVLTIDGKKPTDPGYPLTTN